MVYLLEAFQVKKCPIVETKMHLKTLSNGEAFKQEGDGTGMHDSGANGYRELVCRIKSNHLRTS